MKIEKPTFKKLCFMHLQTLTNFPYIEEDFDAITDYELLCRVVHYLNNVIANENKLTESVISLTNAFNALKDYVDSFFDNLDVQDEINNKLDEMLESGVLEQIIEQFLQSSSLWVFDTVADMKRATNLIDGSYAKTLGFYSINDGGGATYKIKTGLTPNEMNIIGVQNNCQAELICDVANVLQFGCYGDNSHNDTVPFQACANYAETNNLKFYAPNKTYLLSTVTLNNIKYIQVEGTLIFTADTQNLNIYENVNTGSKNIYISTVEVGSIIMKGLNSSDITIQNCTKLILLADNTPNHSFIAYNKFYLGFVRRLIIRDDGSGTKWINENLFFGGRFLELIIGDGDSTYPHQNNLFFKPLCEHTTINIVRGHGNRLIDARLEGNVNITFGELSFANVITTNFHDTIQGYYDPKYNTRFSYTDNSGGKNKVINNEDLTEHLVNSLNIFNNPRNLTTENGMIKSINNNEMFFSSDFIELPDIYVCLNFITSNPNINFRIECYDDTFTKLTTSPNLLINSPTLALTSQGTYGNAQYIRTRYWAIFKRNENVKYIKVKYFSKVDSIEYYKNIQMYLSYYGKLENESYYLAGFKKDILN